MVIEPYFGNGAYVVNPSPPTEPLARDSFRFRTGNTYETCSAKHSSPKTYQVSKQSS